PPQASAHSRVVSPGLPLFGFDGPSRIVFARPVRPHVLDDGCPGTRGMTMAIGGVGRSSPRHPRANLPYLGDGGPSQYRSIFTRSKPQAPLPFGVPQARRLSPVSRRGPLPRVWEVTATAPLGPWMRAHGPIHVGNTQVTEDEAARGIR